MSGRTNFLYGCLIAVACAVTVPTGEAGASRVEPLQGSRLQKDETSGGTPVKVVGTVDDALARLRSAERYSDVVSVTFRAKKGIAICNSARFAVDDDSFNQRHLKARCLSAARDVYGP